MSGEFTERDGTAGDAPETVPAATASGESAAPDDPKPVASEATEATETTGAPATGEGKTSEAGESGEPGASGDSGQSNDATASNESNTPGPAPGVVGAPGMTGSPATAGGEPGRPMVEPPRPPRRVRHGVKLAGKEGPKIESALARRWAGLVAELVVDAEESQEAFKYARAGQTTSLEIAAGGIHARVQGHRGKPYRVRCEVPEWPRDRRDAVVTALATEAASLAALLDGRLPSGLDEMLAGLDLSLLPTKLEFECDCTRGEGCRHAGCVGLLVAERLEQEPLLALAMRGLPAGRLLERLRQQRALEARGLVSAHPDPDVPEARAEPDPLGDTVGHFWRPGARRTELAMGLTGGSADHALLRRLGASPLGGQFPLVGLLASIYDAVRDDAAASESDLPDWRPVDDESDGDGEDGSLEASGATESPAEAAAVDTPADVPAPTPPPAPKAKPRAKAKAKARAKRRDDA